MANAPKLALLNEPTDLQQRLSRSLLVPPRSMNALIVAGAAV
jgi:hypothetical protein